MFAAIGTILMATAILPCLLVMVVFAVIAAIFGVIWLADRLGSLIYWALCALPARWFKPLHKLFFLTLVASVISFGALAGCAEMKALATDVTTDFDTAAGRATIAIAAYEVIKGMAGVAVLADPALSVIVTPAEAALDPLVAKLQAEAADATTAVSTIVSDTDTLTSAANTLASQTAGVIHVVPNSITTTVTHTSVINPREVFVR